MSKVSPFKDWCTKRGLISATGIFFMYNCIPAGKDALPHNSKVVLLMMMKLECSALNYLELLNLPTRLEKVFPNNHLSNDSLYL